MKTLLPILVCVFLSALGFGSELELIQKQFVEYCFPQSEGESSVSSVLSEGYPQRRYMEEHIDYESQRRGEWPTQAMQAKRPFPHFMNHSTPPSPYERFRA